MHKMINHVPLWLVALAMSCAAEEMVSRTQGGPQEQPLASAGPITLNVAPGKCLDAHATNAANGTAVQIYDCNAAPSQTWSYTHGALQVFGNKCIDVTNGSTKNGTTLQIWDCAAGDPNQQWTLNGNAIVWTGHNKCIDLPGGRQSNGTALQIWDCNGNRNQGWNTTGLGGGAPTPTGPVDLGANVFVFDPTMPMANIQATINTVFQKQQTNQFGNDRYTFLFKPGHYTLDVQVGFYTTVHGLGASPDDVTITGAVRTKATWDNGNATQNFWRGVENLSIIPTEDGNNNVWAVAQATALRRIHIKGNINLWDGGWSSGGFIADSLIDHQIVSGSQQQFLTRNTALTQWYGGVWNMVFVGSQQAPTNPWSTSPYTVVNTTPVVREKPYLGLDTNGNYVVMAPALKVNSQGISWGPMAVAAQAIPVSTFYVAHANTDTADSLNAALMRGQNLLLTPGIYGLSSSLQVMNPNTLVLGLGFATLRPDNGTAAMTVADVDGVSVAGVLFDAGAVKSPTLLLVGNAKTRITHAANPTVLSDLSCRVGGASAGKTDSCFTLNSSNVIMDNVWLWRADHGSGVGWTVNPSTNGLIVNGDSVTAYGLFVEHFEEYQTLWNGNGGQVYFYQSEIPYDVPSQASWDHGGVHGYASYKVADSVTTHTAQGLGVYCVFYNPVVLDNAIEAPSAPGIIFNHMTTLWLGVDPNSAINHIYNGTGAAVTQHVMQARSSQ